MLTDFTIRNFRGIKELTLPSLKRVNLFVGKNGVGKTSVLEAVEVWSKGLSPHALWEVLTSRMEPLALGDIRKTLSRLFFDDAASFSLGPNRQENEFELRGLTYSFSFDKGPHPLTTDFGTRVQGHRQANSRLLPARGLPVGQMSLLWEDVATSRRWDADATRAIQAVIPEAETPVMVPKGGTVVPLVGLPSRPERVPVQTLGDGAVRLLELALALAATKGGLLLIDEIENGIHYSAMGKVWRLLLDLAEEYDVQIFATTHSRDAVYALAGASNQDDHIVYRLERAGDNIAAIQFDAKELDVASEYAVEIR